MAWEIRKALESKGKETKGTEFALEWYTAQ